ncbi:MAG: hypothetical protein IT210_02070 [Armatimonadetes bacterium]|nr:hypothetical protein [Armatimonadota bacterium]
MTAEAVREVRPRMEFSAAIFKNPVRSGRFIGQDWRTFPPYVDICIPMDYRGHIPGAFEYYLNLLAESIRSQKEWARDYRSLLIGFAVNSLYNEEDPAGPRPPEKFLRVLDRVRQSEGEGIVVFCVE